jgi:hypothetical protein
MIPYTAQCWDCLGDVVRAGLALRLVKLCPNLFLNASSRSAFLAHIRSMNLLRRANTSLIHPMRCWCSSCASCLILASSVRTGLDRAFQLRPNPADMPLCGAVQLARLQSSDAGLRSLQGFLLIVH